MKTDLYLHAPLLLLALAALCGAILPVPAGEKESSKIAMALQPFVDSRSLAGAVTLVADKDKILDLEAVGYADVAAHKAMATDDLFWIASQSKPITATCLMILNNGTYKGKRLLSEEAVKTMTNKQTGDAVPDGYGLGWSTGGGNFGHGGAYSTNMNIDTNRGLITIWMVQHSGFPNNGDQSSGAFRKAAEDQFGNTHK